MMASLAYVCSFEHVVRTSLLLLSNAQRIKHVHAANIRLCVDRLIRSAMDRLELAFLQCILRITKTNTTEDAEKT